MPIFTPGRRWQPPYSPFKKENFGDRALQVLEYSVKGPLFGCRMCGNCLLQETAFICPMECPKGLRNGPCGGSTSEYCYIDKTRPCIWYKIYERSFQLGREELLLEQKVDDAGKSVEAARSDRDEAARRHIELARQLEKLNEHRKEWTRESEREEQRSDEKVLEDFHRRREEARFTEELDFNVL